MVALLLLAQPATAQWYEETQAIMGTRVHAELWVEDAETARQTLADGDDRNAPHRYHVQSLHRHQ